MEDKTSTERTVRLAILAAMFSISVLCVTARGCIESGHEASVEISRITGEKHTYRPDMGITKDRDD